MPAVAPVAMAAAASTVTSKFNRKASNRVDNNKTGRVKAKERKAKARLHLRND
jgi:hypothetical protein